MYDTINYECSFCGDIGPIDDAATCRYCDRVSCRDCQNNHECGEVDNGPQDTVS
jgi:hypothetical protein